MALINQARLVLLGAIWGGSFLFMRVAAPEFGAALTVEIRVALASLVLLGLAFTRGVKVDFSRDWKYFSVIGLTNSALPYWFFSWAETQMTASLASILNALSPICGLLIGAIWLKTPLRPLNVVGMAMALLGVAGVTGADSGDLAHAKIWPVLACLAATISYGFAANYTKSRSTKVEPLAAAAGSQIVAVLVLIPFSAVSLPTKVPGPAALGAVVLLGLLCTGAALAIFFKLISEEGASKTLTVTFIAPAFGVLWGALFLGESVSIAKIAFCGLILLGTWLSSKETKPLMKEVG